MIWVGAHSLHYLGFLMDSGSVLLNNLAGSVTPIFSGIYAINLIVLRSVWRVS